MYDDVIKLGKSEIETDDYGVQFKKYTYKEIFASIKSVSQSEFYSAAQSGFKPELKFVISDYYDYDGEDRIIYDEKIYSVIRTYRNGQELEITVQKFLGDDDN